MDKEFDKDIDNYFSKIIMNNLNLKQQIIENNVYLVIDIVNNLFKNHKNKSELISIGTVGLIKAIDTYNLNLEIDFKEYIIITIKEEIIEFEKRNKKSNNDMLLNDYLESKKQVNNNYIKSELIKELNYLPQLDRELINLYYGFYGKEFTQNEIADMYKLSRFYVTRTIKQGTSIIGSNLLKKYKLKITSKRINAKYNNKTIYEYFKKYEKDDINCVITELNEEEISILKKMYGDNFEDKCLDICDIGITNRLLTKISRKLQCRLKDIERRNLSKDDYKQLLIAMKSDKYKELLEYYSSKTAIIIIMKLGYINNHKFSDLTIAKFLNMNEDEVQSEYLKALHMYKKIIIDNIKKAYNDNKTK